MFKNTSLTNLYRFPILDIKNIDDMFYGCSVLKLPDISKWNIKNIKNISGLFCHCYKLESLPDISNWDISNVENMSNLFNGCYSLKAYQIFQNGILKM